ncbi:Clavaminate synthase-like protein [Lepidopterella palustris CBS 459.81]|uniref:Clavaminate synthase-like protein n=1 Tax=Lepidopterella palustris CBS 459.81 TaxID=1314670 RepID=A0A8E2JKC3_9PEZI|nr:Clavaminate synthase-like protein [Lepidopterella palustris CBS 459.81]
MEDTAVTVSLDDLRQGNIEFSTLEQAFGPSSLGIILVKDLPPGFAELRHKLLSYSSSLASLPKDELAKLESPASKWLVGWSCGKETLKNGRYDTLKGSYYVNCAPPFEDAALQKSLSEKYPSFSEYTAPNVWPAEDLLPGFERSFRELCKIIMDTAVLVARACDKYASEYISDYKEHYLEHVVKSSVSTKARLLHYFPSSESSGHPETQTNFDEDDWCATHVDHGCLTGLTSAMFVDEAANPPKYSDEIYTLPELGSSPDSKAGLYIHSRSGAVTKVSIPRDHLAFQTGEALEVITEGKFKAVPHFVRGSAPGVGGKVARNTLAIFTQPNLWEMVDKKRDFAAFAREIVLKNH